ncbi:hypothetical protein JQC75_03615 [Shewanella litorisediminis]|uniref:Lipoprotein n=2 Tax=Shewanella litorisediminis TaxID=1173586 RepID=A0ABX7G8H2_9GAMM|nr:hypothetical protein [Shewanella litorisediminis]MCL2917387.1 hypothetical protein [Shewanella litorisediminis]QRH03564.1 hypothetical protein JQC75_03615 [Shewanella litorisediminis]
MLSVSLRPWATALLCTLFLQACVAPMLLLSPQSQLLWALMKPLVGLDPNEVNLLQQPVIKSRLEPLLGEHYGTAVSLLQTANELQQEGPLFYLVSRYTPVPEMAEKAGFVWNSDTNQMAVMLIKGDVTQVFAEPLQQAVQGSLASAVPTWPTALEPFAQGAASLNQNLNDAGKEALKVMPVPLADTAIQVPQTER